MAKSLECLTAINSKYVGRNRIEQGRAETSGHVHPQLRRPMLWPTSLGGVDFFDAPQIVPQRPVAPAVVAAACLLTVAKSIFELFLGVQG